MILWFTTYYQITILMAMLGGGAGFFPEEHYCTLNNLGCLTF